MPYKELRPNRVNSALARIAPLRGRIPIHREKQIRPHPQTQRLQCAAEVKREHLRLAGGGVDVAPRTVEQAPAVREHGGANCHARDQRRDGPAHRPTACPRQRIQKSRRARRRRSLCSRLPTPAKRTAGHDPAPQYGEGSGERERAREQIEIAGRPGHRFGPRPVDPKQRRGYSGERRIAARASTQSSRAACNSPNARPARRYATPAESRRQNNAAARNRDIPADGRIRRLRACEIPPECAPGSSVARLTRM